MKEEGFTLIELLAVIVILAIIALIATPIVLDIIEDSKESSTKRSAELYLNGVEQAIARYQLNGKEFTSETYYVMENGNICTTPLTDKTCTGEEITVTVDGTKPSSGTITINKGEIESINNLYIDKKYINKKDNEIVLSDEEYIEPICKAVTESTSGNYNLGDEYLCKVDPNNEPYTFFILSKEDDKINLIMNSNISKNGVAITNLEATLDDSFVAWITKEDYLEVGGTEEDWGGYGNYNLGPISALNYLELATKNWTNLSKIKIDTYNDDSEQSQTLTKTYMLYARMPYYSELSSLQPWMSTYFEDLNNIPIASGYWTFSAHSLSNSNAYSFISSGFNITPVDSDNTYGVRPVITISKSQLG